MIRRLATAAAAATATLGIALAAAPAASAATTPLGERSLASVLLADGDTFDRSWYDYDIVTQAALAVLGAKPTSAVSVLTNGSVSVTAFLPDDRSFQVLAHDLTGRWIGTEQGVFDALVKAVGVDAIEQVLLYHVVPGATITARDAVRSNGAVLTTAQGGTITVRVVSSWVPVISLRDQDPDDVNPFVNPTRVDINKGNKQIAHGIVFVLRPKNL